ncbi:unnamed protein product, partial [Nesidiocoris tenuis]
MKLNSFKCAYESRSYKLLEYGSGKTDIPLGKSARILPPTLPIPSTSWKKGRVGLGIQESIIPAYFRVVRLHPRGLSAPRRPHRADGQGISPPYKSHKFWSNHKNKDTVQKPVEFFVNSWHSQLSDIKLTYKVVKTCQKADVMRLVVEAQPVVIGNGLSTSDT